MALTNRYANLAQPDLLLTEYLFHIQYLERGPPETPEKF